MYDSAVYACARVSTFVWVLSLVRSYTQHLWVVVKFKIDARQEIFERFGFFFQTCSFFFLFQTNRYFALSSSLLLVSSLFRFFGFWLVIFLYMLQLFRFDCILHFRCWRVMHLPRHFFTAVFFLHFNRKMNCSFLFL